MTRVRLEINSLSINRPKKRWKIYFIVMTENPADPEKMIVSIVPDKPIKIVPSQNNVVDFEGSGNGADGLLLLRREMPENRELNVHCYIRHSHSEVRDFGKILQDIKTGVGADAFEIVSNVLGTTNPGLVIAKVAIPMIGKILEMIPDRDMGFISMFERFGPEFESQEELDREKTGGFSTVVFSWAVDR